MPVSHVLWINIQFEHILKYFLMQKNHFFGHSLGPDTTVPNDTFPVCFDMSEQDFA